MHSDGMATAIGMVRCLNTKFQVSELEKVTFSSETIKLLITYFVKLVLMVGHRENYLFLPTNSSLMHDEMILNKISIISGC